MHIRQKELLEWCGVDEARYRHWRDVLSPLAARRGNKPHFTMGDVLALRLVKYLIDTVGIEPRHLKAITPAMFEDCRPDQWARLEHHVAILTFGPTVWSTQPRTSDLGAGNYLKVDIGAMVSALKAEVLGGTPSVSDIAASSIPDENASASRPTLAD